MSGSEEGMVGIFEIFCSTETSPNLDFVIAKKFPHAWRLIQSWQMAFNKLWKVLKVWVIIHDQDQVIYIFEL